MAFSRGYSGSGNWQEANGFLAKFWDLVDQVKTNTQPIAVATMGDYLVRSIVGGYILDASLFVGSFVQL